MNEKNQCFKGWETLVNYIFFRIHMAYKAKHDSAMLNSILYLSCVLMFVLLPIAGVVLEIARKGGRINTAFLFYISFQS